MAAVIERRDWADNSARWNGEWQGGGYGANICVIFNRQENPGGGAKLHRHPYPETFIIREGTGLFTVGDQQITAVAGQILVVPANTPHKFTNPGPGPLESIDVHENGTFVTEWLE